MRREAINLPGTTNLGPYSDAIVAGGFLFLSGRVGLDQETGRLIEGGIREQTLQCIRNAEMVLKAGGRSLADVVRCTVYITDMAEFSLMNEVYQAQFEAPLPARTTIQVAGLPLGARVEIEMLASLA